MESVIGEIDEIIMLATATGKFFVITLDQMQEMKDNIIGGNFGNQRIIALYTKNSIPFWNIGHIVYEIIALGRMKKVKNLVFARNSGHPMIIVREETRNNVTVGSIRHIVNEILSLERMKKMRNQVGDIGHLDNQMVFALKNNFTVGNIGRFDNAIDMPAPRKVLHQMEK